MTRIAGLDISQDGLDETQSALDESFPDTKFLSIRANVTSEDSVSQAIGKVVAQYGSIHYAVNTAGIGRPLGGTHETQFNKYEEVMSTNIGGVFLCQKYELQQMLKQAPREVNPFVPSVTERGSIVNISSILGLIAMPYLSAYSASKHALLGLTKVDALQYAKEGVRVNVVCPGFVDTPLLAPSIRKGLASTIDRIPQGRLAFPNEVAEVVCFLAGGGACHVTGVVLPVDGGFTAA